MQNKISKILLASIAKSAFDAVNKSINHSLKDLLMVEILRDYNTLAYHMLESKVDACHLDHIKEHIADQLKAKHDSEQNDPELFFNEFIEHLLSTYESQDRISTAHAIIEILNDTTTISSQVFKSNNISSSTLIDELNGHKNRVKPIKQAFQDIKSVRISQSKKPTSKLDQYGIYITDQAKNGTLDSVTERKKDVDRIIQILSRRRKNNPILIGEAGVGKSAIIEGLAMQIVKGEVPETIKNKQIFSLNVSSLIANTKFRGDFEERVKILIDELRTRKDIIIFIDEIHTIIGAGATDGSMDMANLLKPLLSRGELQVIGATTIDEYREYIERDSAIERRFQKIIIEPSSTEQTLEILKNIAPAYEKHHKVNFTERALEACVSLSERYITNRHLPDKAIDVMDEAGVRAHLQAIDTNTHNKGNSTYPDVTELHVAEVLTSMTGIPMHDISMGDADRIKAMQEHLSANIIGQQNAIDKVSMAIKRSQAGLKDSNRPIGVFMFAGPTGVGKTHLAKEIANCLFGKNRGLIRIDMSEYSERHNISRLIGSPPGYEGNKQGGRLTESVRHKPYSVILFDEIEKAHPDVYNLMLQIFDEGRLTDGAGRVVDFKNTIIIMTSNIGSKTVAEKSPQVGYNTSLKQHTLHKQQQTEYNKALESHFSPEFLNRIDNVIIFKTLEVSDIKKIIEVDLNNLSCRTNSLGYKLHITNGAKNRLIAMGYQPKYGARSLRRTITREIEEPLATLIIDGLLSKGGTVIIEAAKSINIKLRVA